MRIPYPVVLASGSPRRRELLTQVVPEFEVVVSEVDETPSSHEGPWALAERLAESKARAVGALRPEALVIGGDTVVAIEQDGWRLLGKPEDEADARRMLRALSGRRHAVITGICLAWPGGDRTASDTTWVTFRDLTDEEIAEYVAGGEPMDKAGGYAIQGGAAPFVASAQGSISNVVGLPLETLEKTLRSILDS